MSFEKFDHSHIKGSRKTHEIIGIYNSGCYKVIRDIPDETIDIEIDYDIRCRFGRALYVNRELIYTGYLSVEECQEHFKKAIEENLKRSMV